MKVKTLRKKAKKERNGQKSANSQGTQQLVKEKDRWKLIMLYMKQIEKFQTKQPEPDS